MITLPRCSFRTSHSGVVSEGVAEVETYPKADRNRCSPSPSTFTLKLTKAVSRRWNLMKVTRRGFFSAEPTVKLKPRKPGMMIIVR